MIRTQVYLTEHERTALASLTRQTGKSQSELIRQAIDFFCESQGKENRAAILQSVRGMWEKRDDLPDFSAMRQELDRSKNKKIKIKNKIKNKNKKDK